MSNKTLPDAYQIADGLQMDELKRRAAQAAQWAIEAKARYTSILDVEKRSQAVIAKVSWEDIVEWAEESGTGTFDLDAYLAEEDGRSALRRACDTILRWIDVVAWVRAIREMYGKD